LQPPARAGAATVNFGLESTGDPVAEPHSVNTVRGRGLPSIQERADRWFCNFTHEEVDALLEELHGVRRAEIESEALIVR